MYRINLAKLISQLTERFPAPSGQIPRSLQEQHDHERAIQRIVDRWAAGHLTVEEKRKLISQENRAYHGVG